MSLLERSTQRAAQVLADQLDSENAFVVGIAATRLIDRAFKARIAVGMEEEVAGLRDVIETLETGRQPAAWEAAELERVPIVVDNEPADAAVARVEWMTLVGMDGAAIASSLRYNRPQSLAEELQLLDLVRMMNAWDAAQEAERATMPGACTPV